MHPKRLNKAAFNLTPREAEDFRKMMDRLLSEEEKKEFFITDTDEAAEKLKKDKLRKELEIELTNELSDVLTPEELEAAIENELKFAS